MFVWDIFKPRKRAFLRGFKPPLNIKRSNTIRLPGDVRGHIARGYRLTRHRGGYVDQREYITDLALRGYERILIKNDQGVDDYNIEKILNLKHRTTRRWHVVKVNLSRIDLRLVDSLCCSVYGLDVYDCLSFLIMVGQDEVNGGITYDKEHTNERIYS